MREIRHRRRVQRKMRKYQAQQQELERRDAHVPVQIPAPDSLLSPATTYQELVSRAP
jgi:hypothetical protein